MSIVFFSSSSATIDVPNIDPRHIKAPYGSLWLNLKTFIIQMAPSHNGHHGGSSTIFLRRSDLRGCTAIQNEVLFFRVLTGGSPGKGMSALFAIGLLHWNRPIT